MRLLAASLILPASVAGALWLAASHFGGSQSSPKVEAEDDPGRQVYMTRCISCHQANGRGITGYFPPLAGTEWVGQEKGRLIRILLHGMTGPAEIQGVQYNGAMPSWGPVLTDAEIAAVLTYIRNTWTNQAPPVSESDVAAVRAHTAGRDAPWTYGELMQEENLTVPGPVQSDVDSGDEHDSGEDSNR